MDILQSGGADAGGKKSFFNHVFATTEEHNAEILNGLQYTALGLLPVIALNKLVQRFVPEADMDKSTIELLLEVFAQLAVMIGGIILIHRAITFLPTYSGYKYESCTITGSTVLLFLVIILSIQTKVGVKVNIMVDRLSELWHGDDAGKKASVKRRVRLGEGGGGHTGSQSDYLDGGAGGGGFPPAPVMQSRGAAASEGYNNMIRTSGGGGGGYDDGFSAGPVPANSVVGGAFNLF